MMPSRGSSSVLRRPLFLDFLAPNAFLYRTNSTLSSRRPRPKTGFSAHPISYQETKAVDPEVVARLRHRIVHLHTPLSTKQSQTFNDELDRMRRALKKGSVNGVMKCYSDLDADGLVEQLPPEVLEQVVKLMADSFGSSPGHSTERLKFFEQFALKAAGLDDARALMTCMMYYLKVQDPDKALDLFLKFLEVDLEKNSPQEDAGEDDDRMEVPESDLFEPSGRVGKRKGEILLAAIAACAMKDSFQLAVQLVLSANIHIPHQPAQYLGRLPLTCQLLANAKSYVRKVEIAHLLSRPASFSKHVINLSRHGQPNSLVNLYKTIINAVTGKDPYIAKDPAFITPTMTVAMTQVGWTALLSAFLERHDKASAGKLWEDMSKLELPHGVALWTVLIDSYGKEKSGREAIAAWDLMLSRRIKPDALTYRAIISALLNSHLTAEALQKFEEFRQSVSHGYDMEKTVSVYNSVMLGLLQNRHGHEAHTILGEMEVNKSPPPDVISYNTFLGHYQRRRDLKKMADISARMTATGTQGDVFTFSALLTALLREGRDDAPQMVFSLMEKQGVKPNAVVHTSMIKHFLSSGEESDMLAAMAKLEAMEKDPKGLPTEVTYHTFLSGIARHPHLSAEKVVEWTNHIVDRMRKRNIPWTSRTYNILLSAWLMSPMPGAVGAAMSHYLDMKRLKVPIRRDTWYILLSGLVDRGEMAKAKLVVSDLRSTKFEKGRHLSLLVRRIETLLETSPKDTHIDQ